MGCVHLWCRTKPRAHELGPLDFSVVGVESVGLQTWYLFFLICVRVCVSVHVLVAEVVLGNGSGSVSGKHNNNNNNSK